ncbi:outer membrane protein assembly factor BamB [Propionivibrio sp.]|uniref:outer membrane protein assembly factor BamB n=1 Tax=Propionivibrio sp. TaxID=2212460 RepID=UPI00272E97A4|nr:outer membrane protein assembly factor BamB [Propionivibrio sp.]
MRRSLIVIPLLALVAGCASLDAINPFAKKGPKMAELKPFTATAQTRVVWQESVGKGGDYAFTPAVSGSSVYAAGNNGVLARIEDGKTVWKVEAGQALSAGVGTDGRLVAVGSPEGDLLVFGAADGKLAWKAKATSEILAPPAVGEGLVIVRSGDNRLIAYDAADGKRRWVFQRPAPALSLRATAAPVIDGKYVFAGFPGGKLIAVNLSNGAPVWEGTVALPKGTTELERIADISSSPVIAGRTICAVAYQGRVACFDLGNGNLVWARDVSSSVGLAMDSRHLFVSDDKGAVHALDLASGASLWKQDGLSLRRLSAPVVRRNLVAVADVQGVVHFLNREDGAFAARLTTDGGAVVAPPQPVGRNLLVQTSKGGLYAIEAE